MSFSRPRGARRGKARPGAARQGKARIASAINTGEMNTMKPRPPVLIRYGIYLLPLWLVAYFVVQWWGGTQMIRWDIGRRWLVVSCSPRGESVASAKARELGYTVFYPHSRFIKTVPKKKPTEVIEPYLPGYIFAASDRRLSVYDLERAQGVRDVLQFAGEYALIPDTDPVMRHLLKMAGDDGEIARQEAKSPITLIKAGETVKAKDGPFAGIEGLVAKVDAKRQTAQVWLKIFGGDTLATFEVGQIEAAKQSPSAA